MSNNLSHAHGGNFSLTAGGWAEGTNANTIKSANTVTFVINGRLYSKAATDNIAISYTASSTINDTAGGAFTGGANGSTRVYGIFLDTAGAVSIVPGPIVDTAALAAGSVVLQYPSAQKDKAPTAMMRIAVTSGTTFTPGSTDLSAAGVTDTWYDVCGIPSAPLTS